MKLRTNIDNLVQFLNEGIWDVDSSKYGLPQRIGLYLLKLVLMVMNEFVEERCKTKAAALTFITLFALVPCLAVAFSLFKVFGGLSAVGDKIWPYVFEYIATGSQDIVIEKIQVFIENISAGAIGGVGIVLLFLSAVSLLTNVESALNDVWGVTRSRKFFQRFIVYWSIITVGPVLLGVSLSITATVQSTFLFGKIMEYLPGSGLLISWIPVLFTCATFTFIYFVMPNTSVQVRAAITGGIIGGLLFEVAKWGYTIYAAKAIKYSAIYGTLGAIPLFILWIYLSWVVILIGAVVSFSLENISTYKKEVRALSASNKVKELLGIRIMVEVAGAFDRGDEPPSDESIAHKLGIPIRLIRYLINVLVESKLLLTTVVGSETCYVPGTKFQVISVGQIKEAIKNYAGVEIHIKDDDEQRKINEVLKKASLAERELLSLETLDKLICSKEMA